VQTLPNLERILARDKPWRDQAPKPQAIAVCEVSNRTRLLTPFSPGCDPTTLYWNDFLSGSPLERRLLVLPAMFLTMQGDNNAPRINVAGFRSARDRAGGVGR
jgi:hypothetical protein